MTHYEIIYKHYFKANDASPVKKESVKDTCLVNQQDLTNSY
jgi:hypothetical protein